MFGFFLSEFCSNENQVKKSPLKKRAKQQVEGSNKGTLNTKLYLDEPYDKSEIIWLKNCFGKLSYWNEEYNKDNRKIDQTRKITMFTLENFIRSVFFIFIQIICLNLIFTKLLFLSV